MPPEQMLSHLSNDIHRHNRMNVDEALYQDALQQAGVAKLLPSPPTDDTIPPVYGLALTAGYYCDHCTYNSQTLESLKRHQRQDHSNISLNGRMHTLGSIQRFNSSNGRKWFRVQTPPTSTISSHDSFFTTALQTINSHATSITTADNIHNLSPWLRLCGWNDYTDNEDATIIRSQVSMPDEDDFPALPTYVEIYMQAADDYIDSTHCLIFNKLGTDNAS